MKNYYNIQGTQTHTHQHNVEQTVTEKRAPTDESVRLLREMEQVAEKNIIDIIKVDTNILTGIVLVKQFGVSFFQQKTYHVKFNLNGKEYLVKDIKTTEWTDKKAMVNALFEKISQAIAEIIIKENLKMILE